MLNLKKLLTKVLKRLNFRTVTVTASEKSINADSTGYVTVPYPTNGKVVGISGWQIGGSSYCLIYRLELVASGCQLALRNTGTGTAAITPSITYIVVD